MFGIILEVFEHFVGGTFREFWQMLGVSGSIYYLCIFVLLYILFIYFYFSPRTVATICGAFGQANPCVYPAAESIRLIQ